MCCRQCLCMCLRKQRRWWQRCGKIDVGLGKCKCESRERTRDRYGDKRKGLKRQGGYKGAYRKTIQSLRFLSALERLSSRRIALFSCGCRYVRALHVVGRSGSVGIRGRAVGGAGKRGQARVRTKGIIKMGPLIKAVRRHVSIFNISTSKALVNVDRKRRRIHMHIEYICT